MIVVADSGPIHYLVLIGDVDVLLPLFSRVLIPDAVRSELTHTRTPPIVRQWIANPPEWAEIRSIRHSSELLLAKFGPGEHEAILLARQLSADYLLIDDARARSLAEAESVRTIRTIGILRSAARRGLIDLRSSIEKLMATNFRISSSFLNRIRQEVDQS
jgi:predicted nucleic acid-binding protein